jgi:hypothetical protein
MNYITFEEGLALAAEWSLEYEYINSVMSGDTPEEALRDWDII